jgi:lipid II:glycine glycyltransferase (peptidoglycan interpeptide bridge formation enzyme)
VPGSAPAREYFVHDLRIGNEADLQFRSMRDCQRRNIRKAERLGVQIHESQSGEAIRAYYQLHCLTRKRHGVPPQPPRFFEAIQRHVMSEGRGFVLLARFEGQWIAGAVYFRFGTKAVYKFGASDLSFQHLRANSLLMWAAINRLRALGIQRLSFGRTDTDNAGLLQFKRGWGAEESRIRYYRLGIWQNVAPQPLEPLRRNAVPARLMRSLPQPVLRLIGSALYKHIG